MSAMKDLGQQQQAQAQIRAANLATTAKAREDEAQQLRRIWRASMQAKQQADANTEFAKRAYVNAATRAIATQAQAAEAQKHFNQWVVHNANPLANYTTPYHPEERHFEIKYAGLTLMYNELDEQEFKAKFMAALVQKDVPDRVLNSLRIYLWDKEPAATGAAPYLVASVAGSDFAMDSLEKNGTLKSIKINGVTGVIVRLPSHPPGALTTTATTTAAPPAPIPDPAPTPAPRPPRYAPRRKDDGGNRGPISSSCFPADALLISSSGHVRMDQLRLGDKVLGFHHGTGKPEFTTVRAWLHRSTSAHIALTKLHTDVGTVAASPQHSLAAGSAERFLFAEDILPGQSLVTPSGTADVRSISKETGMGVYAPLTEGSNFFVRMGTESSTSESFLAHSFSHWQNPRSFERAVHIVLSVVEFFTPKIHEIDDSSETDYVHPVCRVLAWLVGIQLA
eukprot:gnl/TRDRNA2_/TRDRNA2_100258_c1_seq1.p1 gnl/TRDRNA2_/TRDRNA2_100258_c1~~gnl/TRDRNA2_/TRDRNA2_100258_c1_seq1.p1  ORF type:complete len:461 (-),score=75.31 gnl/TRDRNA2_/TRDRNA2_100258_c1_seq1:117-1469(-)